MIGGFAYSIPDQYQVKLTAAKLAAILAPLFSKRKAGICRPDNQGHRPLFNVAFLYPPKSQVLVRLVFAVMVGCIGQPLKRLAGSLAGSANLIQSATQSFAPLIGGYSTDQGVTAMKSQNQSVQNSGQVNHSLSDAALASVESAIEALLDLDEALQAMPNNDEARRALSPTFRRVAEIHKAVRRYETSKKLPESYPVENKDDFLVGICRTGELMPTVYPDALMLMKKNHQAEVGDIVLVDSDYQNPRFEFCQIAGIYPAVCVAAKAQLLEILPDGSVSKPR
ncbi:MAG: hypothetical protein ACXV79_05190 [Methylobacter sp.]